jgi:hypothetical protein
MGMRSLTMSHTGHWVMRCGDLGKMDHCAFHRRGLILVTGKSRSTVKKITLRKHINGQKVCTPLWVLTTALVERT